MRRKFHGMQSKRQNAERAAETEFDETKAKGQLEAIEGKSKGLMEAIGREEEKIRTFLRQKMAQMESKNLNG